MPGRGAEAEIPCYFLSPQWHRTGALQAVTPERARGSLWGKWKMSPWRVREDISLPGGVLALTRMVSPEG